jgi:hypothetical protein
MYLKDTLNTNQEQVEANWKRDYSWRVYSWFFFKTTSTTQAAIDSIGGTQWYYQLGVIYKEKFKEYELATNKLEQLLQNSPEEN